MDAYPIPYRRAAPEDAAALAELIDIAGDGLPSFCWGLMASRGETAADVGRRRAQGEEGSFSFRNAIVADSGSGAVAALMGHPLPDRHEARRPGAPGIRLPLPEIEEVAQGTWYVNVLAAYPPYRNQGHGTRLLKIAGKLARESGRRGLSLAVVDANEGARRLYERMGFRHMATCPLDKEVWPVPGRDLLLLIREGMG